MKLIFHTFNKLFFSIIIAAAAVDQNQTVWTKSVTQENK